MISLLMSNEIRSLHYILLFCSILSSASQLVSQDSNKMMGITRCIGTERQALLDIKRSLVDTNGRLLSWADENCCQWSGVGSCDLHTGHVTNLNISYLNYFNDYNSPPHSLSSISYSLIFLRHLQYLDLSHNKFAVPLPSFIGSLTNLVYLNLSGAGFRGAIPNELGNLSKLNYLDLSSNAFESGPIPKFIASFSSLTYLDLSDNQFSEALPDQLGNLSKLHYLDLSCNMLQGPIPNSFGVMTSITYLNLSANHLKGVFPNSLHYLSNQSIGQLSNLYQLNLSRNSISSTIYEHHLSKLYSLRLMDASFNSLIFDMSSEWLPPCNLEELLLASCKLGPLFPTWIRNQTGMIGLDLSNTQISGTIPLWFWDMSTTMQRLDLSSNRIKGTFSSIPLYIEEIDLSSNSFEGPVPPIPPQSSKINLSHNKFSGNLLPMSKVEGTTLSFLDLSHNSLFGEVPNSWIYFQDLVFLDLGNNNLSGKIPTSIGYLRSLRTLILRNNSLTGELPKSLRNCSHLGFVDFGLNSLSGIVPEWIGQDLTQLYALILKSNKFYGSMPYDLCHLSNLRFLDLSKNRISGSVPQCLSNLTAMIQNTTGITDHYYTATYGINFRQAIFSYFDDAFAGWKGKERECGSSFAYLKMIDLSSNELTGEIPIGMTRLLGLNGLNLSRNKFYGEVPEQIGGLIKLESLDLSSNNFSGKIPQSMSVLTFLSYLDLSRNNFSGRIPSGSQLQLFNSSTYKGNAGLCGFPLTKRCPEDKTSVKPQPSSNGNEDEDDILYERWLYVSAAIGFTMTFSGICGTVLISHWRHEDFLF